MTKKSLRWLNGKKSERGTLSKPFPNYTCLVHLAQSLLFRFRDDMRLREPFNANHVPRCKPLSLRKTGEPTYLRYGMAGQQNRTKARATKATKNFPSLRPNCGRQTDALLSKTWVPRRARANRQSAPPVRPSPPSFPLSVRPRFEVEANKCTPLAAVVGHHHCFIKGLFLLFLIGA